MEKLNLTVALANRVTVGTGRDYYTSLCVRGLPKKGRQ